MNIREIIEKDIISLNNKEYIFEKRNNIYKPILFNDFVNKAKSLATYLINNGLKGERVLIIGKNSINYMISDLAITVYSGICVNINRDTKEKDLTDIIKNMDIKGIIYTAEQKDKIEKINENVFKLNIDAFAFDNEPDELLYKHYDENICSKIFFSSGTTSKPKGVMLSLKNIFAGWSSLQKRTKFSSFDIVYLFLPLHHTYGNIYNFYYSFLSGLSIYLSSGVDNIFSELKEVNPTVFCGVPLIFERAYQALGDNIKYAFGNRIKYLYIGGAPLSMALRTDYKKNGLELLNAYALTETASSFSIDYPGDTNDESAGTIFENLDVKIIDKIGEIGEIVVKGDAVFLGYTTETADVFTNDGYFKTGDLGYIKNNKLYLSGRKKKVLIGSNGENIFVDEIAEKLKELDSNINHVNVRLIDNDISVVIYLEDAKLTEIEKLISEYNSRCVQKNKIKKYEISEKKNYEKLLA